MEMKNPMYLHAFTSRSSQQEFIELTDHDDLEDTQEAGGAPRHAHARSLTQKRSLHPRRHTDGQYIYKKMLNVTNHQRNAN